jgi:hypothetical protein
MMSRSRLSVRVWAAGRCFLVPEPGPRREAERCIRLGTLRSVGPLAAEVPQKVRSSSSAFPADGQVPVLGDLPVPGVVDIGVLGGAGEALAG